MYDCYYGDASTVETSVFVNAEIVDRLFFQAITQKRFALHRGAETGQCIPLTKSLGPLDLGPVQVIFSCTKWGVFIGPIPVGPGNNNMLNHAFCL